MIFGRTEILTELLSRSPLPERQARDQIEHIRQSARRLTAMVEDLISDALADAVDISVRTYTLDLGVLVSEVSESNRKLALAKNQDLKVFVEPALRVEGDTERLREAVDNLISNAVKYSPLGGRIDVTATRVGKEALIRVADQGPGLSPEDEDRVFGRFQRLSAKPTAGESSTGLGLSIAKRIIDLHKGRIFVEKSRSVGRCRLHHRLALAARHGCGMSQQQNIFVCDDEAAARDMIGDYLKMHGFDVTLCTGGPSLRAEVAKARPDLVVLDLNMPEEDGLSLIRFLKQSGNVPVIMLTATASPIDRVVGLELGADDYLAKPCEMRELLARVRSVLRRSAAAAAVGTGRSEPHGENGHEMARPRRAHAARRGGERASAHRLGVRSSEGLCGEPEAGADARAAARPCAGTRR